MAFKRILVHSITVLLLCLWSTLAFGSSDDVQPVTLRILKPVYMKALVRFSPWSAKELNVSGLQAYPSRVWVPKGKLSFHIDPPPNSSFLGRVSMLINVKVNGKVARRVRVCGRVEVYRQVLSFSRPLQRGHVLTKEDLMISRRALSRLNSQVLDDAKMVVGQALKRSVRAGQAVSPEMLTPPVVVRRGDRVTIVAQDSSLLITVPGEVKQDGAKGCFVRVRNIMSHREVVAQVLDSKTVKVVF